MSYTITLTDGTTLTTVNDGSIDQTSTDLTLIGKNSTNYGAFLNDNFVRILENFANTSQPNYPIIGQLWYDTSENILKVYNGSSFTTTSGTIVSSTVPSSIGSGDLWINNSTGQLYFNDGLDTILAGPLYTSQQGVSGFNVESIIDTAGVNHTVVVLYVARTVIGIFSKDTFTPASSIPGFTSSAQFTASQTLNVLTVTAIASGSLNVGQTISGVGVTPGTIITDQLTGLTGSTGTYTVSNSATVLSTTITASSSKINIGFNVGSYPGIVFDTVVSRAQSLVASDGSLKTASNFLSSVENSTTSGQINIQNNNPLILGTGSNIAFNINSSSNIFQINSNTSNLNFSINLDSNGSLVPSLFINAQNQYLGINTSSPGATLDVNGNTIIRGNLTVQGSTDTINSTTVNIADKNINLGTTSVPTDTTASGGGITLLGTTNKFIDWLSTASSSTSTNSGYWNISDFINLCSSNASVGYYINGTSVLSSTSLGSGITSAPGLTSIGALTGLQAAYLNIANSTVSYVNSGSANGTIYLVAKGSGTVDVGSTRITNVSTPSNDTDASNKSYVDTAVSSINLGLSLVTTGLTTDQIAANLLNKIFPVLEHQNNTYLRVQCSDSTIKQYQLISGVWTYQTNL
jgi:hypothetical protein